MWIECQIKWLLDESAYKNKSKDIIRFLIAQFDLIKGQIKI